jgi:hypothetical protein
MDCCALGGLRTGQNRSDLAADRRSAGQKEVSNDHHASASRNLACERASADDAEISVQGTMLLQREEPTGDIVEVDRYPVKGTVKLQRKDGVWRYAGTEKLER